MSRRNITSVIDDIENVSSVWKFFFKATVIVGYNVKNISSEVGERHTGSLRRSMNSMVLASREFMILLTRDTRKL